MKVKDDFVLRRVGEQNVVIPVGEASLHFNGFIELNDSAASIWCQLLDDRTIDEVTAALLEEYDISEELARTSVCDFVKQLEEANLLE